VARHSSRKMGQCRGPGRTTTALGAALSASAKARASAKLAAEPIKFGFVVIRTIELKTKSKMPSGSGPMLAA